MAGQEESVVAQKNKSIGVWALKNVGCSAVNLDKGLDEM
jgi:hypothetical protein